MSCLFVPVLFLVVLCLREVLPAFGGFGQGGKSANIVVDLNSQLVKMELIRAVNKPFFHLRGGEGVDYFVDLYLRQD